MRKFKRGYTHSSWSTVLDVGGVYDTAHATKDIIPKAEAVKIGNEGETLYTNGPVGGSALLDLELP